MGTGVVSMTGTLLLQSSQTCVDVVEMITGTEGVVVMMGLDQSSQVE